MSPPALRLLAWNLFHGRDFPPDIEGDLAWKLRGRPVAGERHCLVNRNLFVEFAAFLAAAEWDLALLQEVPPRWSRRLGEATGSTPFRTLTSRNWMRPFTFPVARARPQLTGSWEGGSNLILMRPGCRPGDGSAGRETATLTWRPERRTVSMARLAGGLCVANLHASTGRGAEPDILRAAGLATRWAGEAPLVLAGDFNARPGGSEIFDQLEREFGLSGITATDSIDHILARGIPAAGPARPWAAGRRDVPDDRSDLLIRLSDHAPVTRSIPI